ncbi:isochorismate synthase [Leucobacter sp. cx-42]|nr:isochorismate synthase [Leucobacter sp. cx-42]
MTRPLLTDGELPELLAFADPQQPLYWNRGDRGAVGIGEAIRLEFSGAHRFTEASRMWRRIAAAATVENPVGLPGTGLLAFGTFTFDARSEHVSVLIVPRTIIGRSGDQMWRTEVSVTDAGAAADAVVGAVVPVSNAEIPVATPFAAWDAIDLASPETFATASGCTAQSPGTIAGYTAGVVESVRRIDAGDLEKVVLSRQLEGRIAADADIRTPLARLSAEYLNCWTFAIDGLVGSSPETLARVIDGKFEARVLAGTRPRTGLDAVADEAVRAELLASDKDQHEHAFAAQSVVTTLSPHLTDLTTSEEPFALQLPNVWHLATDVRAQLAEDVTTLELVAAMHPTAAIGGTPTIEAVEVIHELEPFDRGRYSGAVGWIDGNGDGEWVIALRCAQIGGPVDGTRSIVASAGGGLVAGSDPEHELLETVSKFRPITTAFGA